MHYSAQYFGSASDSETSNYIGTGSYSGAGRRLLSPLSSVQL